TEGIHGSSPRVWGIHLIGLHQARAKRFIPTCVGNTPSRLDFCISRFGSSPRVWGIPRAHPRGFVTTAVHPHVCGEYLARIRAGLSHPRFIPTCVGNTRVCLICRFCVCGSSPRVWG